jgi:hypothetical protein
MAETKKDSTKPDIRTSSPPGSRTWGCRYPVGSVLFDTPSPGTQEDTAKNEKLWRNTVSPSFRASKDNSSIFPNDLNGRVSQGLLDIFGNNPDTRDAPYPNRSVKMNDLRLAVRSRTKKTRIPNLVPPPKRLPIAERKSTNENEGLPEGRRSSRTDHPLKSFKPFEQINTGDAEDLDLENKIRSALSHRTRRSSPEKPTAKSVRWDPAIIPHSPESTRFVGSKPAIQKGHEIALIQGMGLRDCLQTILSLKKNDRHKLCGFLDALAQIDGDNPNVQAGSTTEGKGKGPLNPKAPEFRTISPVRHHIHPENLNDQNAWFTLDTPGTSLPIQPVGRLFVQNMRMNDIHQGDDGQGREAKSIDPTWANSILEKFTTKYPLTGKLKAATPSEAKGRLAAAIQQRLEYLLLQEKEKKALRGRENQPLKLSERLGVGFL